MIIQKQLTIAARYAITSVSLLIAAGLAITALSSPAHQPILLTAIAAAVGGAVATFTIAVRLVRLPIHEVTRAALEMAEDHLYERARIQGDDEIGTLAKTLNHLAGDLSDTINTLQHERDLLAAILDRMIKSILVMNE